MTKDLSRQLCEIAGIEAKYILATQSEDGYFYEDFNKEENKKLYNHFKVAEFVLSEKLENGLICSDAEVVEIYPNFETPENFVKLLKQVIHFQGGYDFFTETCEIELMESVTNIFSCVGDDIEKFKQALQAQDWRYS